MNRHTPIVAALLAFSIAASAPTSAQPEGSAAALWFDAHRDRPPLLRQFLQRLPKGADLHSHFSGAIYAESFLDWAAADQDCIDKARLVLVAAPCRPGGNLVPAGRLDDATYDAMVDRMSTKDLSQSGRSGHDQFFGTFDVFGLVGDDPRHGTAMLTEIRNRAAAENVQHLELISGIQRECRDAQDTCIANLAGTLAWPEPADGRPGQDLTAEFARMEDQLRAAGLPALVAEASQALHAGELTLGLVPPERLRTHIREAVTVAGAERIGHGVAIGYEDSAFQTLRIMADRDTAVEVCLTSNDLILGVKGQDHPFPDYLAAGVPVVLASDDAGVSRIDLTNEYLRAVRDYGLSYAQLKQLSRNGLTYSFLSGASLWRDPASAAPVAACAQDEPGSVTPSETCRNWLAGSAKASRQWALEAAFLAFERADDWAPGR